MNMSDTSDVRYLREFIDRVGLAPHGLDVVRFLERLLSVTGCLTWMHLPPEPGKVYKLEAYGTILHYQKAGQVFADFFSTKELASLKAMQFEGFSKLFEVVLMIATKIKSTQPLDKPPDL